MRELIVQEARSWIGTPWRHQGRNKYGIDCAGLILKVAHALNISEFDTFDYQRYPSGNKFLDYFTKNNCKYVMLNKIQLGDILILNMGPYPCHCGIYTGNDMFIHSFVTRRGVIEEKWHDKFKQITFAAYSYPGVE